MSAMNRKNHCIPLQIPGHAVWCHFRSPRPCGWSRSCWTRVALLLGMKRSGNEGGNSARPMQSRWRGRGSRCRDIWHLERSLYPSEAENAGCGGPSIRVAARSTRSSRAAKRLLFRPLKKQGITPRCIVAHKLLLIRRCKTGSYPDIDHRSDKGLKDKAQNSHVLMRNRGRMIRAPRSFCDA